MFSRRGIMKAMGVATAAPALAKITEVPGATYDAFAQKPLHFNEGVALGMPQRSSLNLMSHWQAAQLALRDPAALAAARSIAFKRNRHIVALDPDIAVVKSWSSMAKVTFQRQRQVDRDIEGETIEQIWDILAPVRDQIHRLRGDL